MSEPILKPHGADAFGLLAQDDDGQWRASLTVRTQDGSREQQRGPEIFASEDVAADWVYRQAGHHGFKPDQFDLLVEPKPAG